MPATERTYYNIRRLHVLFAISAVLLMLATVWMLARDHLRPWKRIQRTNERIELKLAKWKKHQVRTEELVRERKRLREVLAKLMSRPFPAATLDAFRSQVRADARRREAPAPSFTMLDDAVSRQRDAAAVVHAARAAWHSRLLEADTTQPQSQDAAIDAGKVESDEAGKTTRSDTGDTAQRDAAAEKQKREELKRAHNELRHARERAVAARRLVLRELESFLNKAEFREDKWERRRRAERAELDVKKAELGLAVRDQFGADKLKQLQDAVERKQKEVRKASRAAEAAKAHRQKLRHLLVKLTEKTDALQARLQEKNAQSSRLDEMLAEKRSTYFNYWGILPVPGKKWLELPLFDAFNSPRKIENLWSAKLDRPAGSFGRVPRFDRCTTCHEAIQKARDHAPSRPAFSEPEVMDFAIPLPVPGEDKATNGDNGANGVGALAAADRLKSAFGLALADEGLLNSTGATIRLVQPSSPGSQARRWHDVGRMMRAGDLREQMFFASPPLHIGNNESSRGCRLGDAIVAVDGQPVPAGSNRQGWVTKQLLKAASAENRDAEAPLRVRVERGLPHPYAGHPRLDLFVGENSPHPMSKFGCTVCHEGQGSATSFKWASHIPNSPQARRRWREQYDWFDNPNWNYPMYPRQFIESSCLKCHHDVVELERTPWQPDTPAPKLTKGYRLIRGLGCFGCHKIDGYDSAQRRIGPDLRLEPNYHAAALQFKGNAGSGYQALAPDEKATVDRLIDSPRDESLRRAVQQILLDRAPERANELLADSLVPQPDEPVEKDQEGGESELSRDTVNTLLPLLEPIEQPGTLRKVGPSLRFVRHKLQADYLSEWIRQPRRLRPSTRMPSSFGLWNHLPAEQWRARRATLQQQLAEAEATSEAEPPHSVARIEAELEAVNAELARVDEIEKRFEPIAIYSMVQYLLQRSQDYRYIEPPNAITPVVTEGAKRARIERGKVAFEQRGCLACHDHVDFPDVAAYRETDELVAGPDLSRLSDKFATARNADGPRWLYSWLAQPTRYSPRTTMPDMRLEPVEHRDVNGNVNAITDPTADIVAYLLHKPGEDWKPADGTWEQLDAQNENVLKELALTYLKDTYPTTTARGYLQQGIPSSQQGQVRGAERELLVAPGKEHSFTSARMTQKWLFYVAKKSFTNSGCAACHDIPGMENARPIGPELNDWGRKETKQLAFGHVAQYVKRDSPRGSVTEKEEMAGSDLSTAKKHIAPIGLESRQKADPPAVRGRAPGRATAAAATEPPWPWEEHLHQLQKQSRIGFLHQKLLEPRSFEYHEARNKEYTDRLRMPRFSLTADEREAVMTFVLGLVTDPPQHEYVYAPPPQTKAILAGQEILTKYSCRSCHIMEPEKWHLTFPPGEFGQQPVVSTYPSVRAEFTLDQLADSRRVDKRGERHARIEGMPALSGDGLPLVLDDVEFPIEEEEDETFRLEHLIYAFNLWKPAPIDGYPYQVGTAPLDVLAANLTKRRRSRGGSFTKYLLPRVVEREREENPNAQGAQAWAWLPPALTDEGLKVQLDWLHDYLLQPRSIRPAMVMRMPRYNLPSREAAQLVDCFAARNNVQSPFNFDPARHDEHLERADQEYAQRLKQLARAGELKLTGVPNGRHLADAMRVVSDKKYCVTCHVIGDYQPPGSDRAKAPDLTEVHLRLRSDYLRQWLAKPTSIQPYTPMPMNISYDDTAPLQGSTVPQELYHGNSTQQLEALVDLLMNYDRYVQQQAPVSPMVKSGSISSD